MDNFYLDKHGNLHVPGDIIAYSDQVKDESKVNDTYNPNKHTALDQAIRLYEQLIKSGLVNHQPSIKHHADHIVAIANIFERVL